MSAIVPMNPADWQSRLPQKNQIDQMGAEQLCEVLRLCSTLSDAVLQVAAWAWARLEELGADLTEQLDSNPYLFRRIRDIAHERLSVEAAMKFGGKTHILDFVRKQSREVQDRLVADDRVLFVVKGPSNELDERKLHLAALDREQLKQLVTPDGEIRTPNQQRAYLSPSPVPPVRDTPRGRVIITRGKLRTEGEVPIQAVIRALQEKGHLPVAVEAQ
jgi:hypothetical protein